jgi:hypothetical protein
MKYWLVISKIKGIGETVLAETEFHAIQKVIYTSIFLGHKPSDFKVVKL